MQVMVEDIARDLLAQFTHWIRERRGPCSSDGTRDYCGPPQVEVETLLVAGTGDELGPLRSMVEVAAMLGDRAQVHVVGRSARDQAADLSATGARVTVDPTEHEWGHADLIMGREAPARVYEAISAFVAKVDGRDLADGAGGAP